MVGVRQSQAGNTRPGVLMRWVSPLLRPISPPKADLPLSNGTLRALVPLVIAENFPPTLKTGKVC